MKAQPLLFLGDRRRTALQDRIAAAARRWRQAWAPQTADTFEATCEPPGAAGFSAPVAAVAIGGWELTIGGERVAVLLLPHVTFAWCVHEAGGAPLDGAAAVSAGSLGEKLEHEVARSVLLETCGSDRREVGSVERASLAELGEWTRAARAWTVNVRSATGRSFTLLVAAARIELLAPVRAALSSQLARRSEAVGENTVMLRALVGETRVPVGELAGLAVDDVLVLDQSLGEQVALVCGEGSLPVVAGNLGRAGARRAIKIANAPRN